MADEFKLSLEGMGTPQPSAMSGLGDWIFSFGKSAVESIPELVGITPSPQTLSFRAENPIAGFTSELAGMAVPYGGWMRMARGIKGLEAMATGIEASKLGTEAGKAAYAAKALEAPFFTAAKAEAVRLAPFEVGRVIASQAVGDQPFADMAVGAGLNLALGAGIMGGFSKLGSIGKVAPGLRDIAPSLDETLPPQLLLRQMDELVPNMPPERVGDLLAARADIDAAARREVLPPGPRGKSLYRYTDETIGGKANELERLFHPGGQAGGALEVKLPVMGETAADFGNNGEWQQIFSEAGIAPERVAKDLQFPRVVRVNAEPEIGGVRTPDPERALDWARRVEERIGKNLEPVGDGWFMKQEPNQGMFVMARKIRGITGEALPSRDYWVGQVKGKWTTWQSKDLVPPEAKNVRQKSTNVKVTAKPGVDDTWVLFKTDKPGEFVKNSQGLMNAQVARERWIAGQPALEALSKDGGLVGEIVRSEDKLPLRHYMDAWHGAGQDTSKIGQFFDRVSPKVLKNSAALKAGTDAIREYMTPFAQQFKKSPRANWVANRARLIQDAVDSYYQGILQGEKALGSKTALLTKIVNVPAARRNLETLWSELDKEGLREEFFSRVYRPGHSAVQAAELAAKGEINPRTAAIAEEIENLFRSEHAEINKALKAAGQTELKWREGTYGLPRSWDGDYFALVRNEAGDIVGAAASGSQKGAREKAEGLAKKLSGETGVSHKVAQEFHRNAEKAGLPSDVVPFLRNPGGTLQGRQIRGFRWDHETPDLPTLMKEAQQYLQGRARVLGTHMRNATLNRHISALSVEDPVAAKMLVKRLSQMAGEEGEFAKATNKLADAVLSRFGFGSNTATKIVAATNTGITHLQLGAFKMTYPLQNIVGVIQTVMPEVAFVMNATDKNMLASYGTTWPAFGTRGSVGTVSTLAPVKVLGQAVKELVSPSADFRQLMNRLINERVVDARVAEEYIGQNRRSLGNWKGALTSPKAFGEFVLALSEWMPMHSERFARTLSAAAAYRVLKYWAKVADPDMLFMQTKRFVERTNYLYSSADRPVAFTGPVGSSLGLFKNWQMNYIHTMAEYANMGVNKGVWSPLIWQTMGTAALGGAAATPLFWAAEGASNLFAQKHLVQLAYDEWHDGADGVMFGLPAALTGVSMSGLMSSPGANPVKDATQLFTFAGLTRMNGMGSAIKAAFDNWQATGQHPATDPDVRNNLAKAFAPVVLQRAMAIDGDAVNNLGTGLPMAKGLSVYDRITYLMGAQPTTLERQMAASNIIYQDREKMRAATTAFGEALGEAWANNDSRLADIIIERALAQGVNPFQSARTRLRNQDKTTVERLAKPEVLQSVESLLR